MATTNFMIALTDNFGPYWYVFLIGMVGFMIASVHLFNERKAWLRYSAGAMPARAAAYKQKKVLGRLADKAGTEIEFVLETDDQYPGTVDAEPTLFNPNLVTTKRRGRLTNGTPLLNYVLPYPMPMSYTDGLALSQLIEHVRKNHPEISWIVDDLLVIMLIGSSEEYLHVNCVNAVETCVGFGIDIPEEFVTEADDDDGYEEYDDE